MSVRSEPELELLCEQSGGRATNEQSRQNITINMTKVQWRRQPKPFSESVRKAIIPVFISAGTVGIIAAQYKTRLAVRLRLTVQLLMLRVQNLAFLELLWNGVRQV